MAGLAVNWRGGAIKRAFTVFHSHIEVPNLFTFQNLIVDMRLITKH